MKTLIFGLLISLPLLAQETTNVCARGEIGKVLVEITKSESCEFVRLEALAGIEELSIMKKKISAIQDGDLVGLNSLKKLSLPENEISQISVNAFVSLKKLEVLNLHKNKLTTFPVQVPQLLELNLSSNQIKSIKKNMFFGANSLTSLNLADNYLEFIETGSFKGMKFLTHLDLSGNFSKTLPAGTLIGLQNLQNFKLNSFYSDRFPEEITTLVKLRSLEMEHSFLKQFPLKQIQKLTQLKRLRLSGTRMKLSPFAFESLKNLEELYILADDTLPANVFAGLSNVKKLNVFSSQLKSIQADAFAGLHSLEKLKIEGATVHAIEPGAFNGLSTLKELWVEVVRLPLIPANFCQGLPQVERMFLIKSEIEQISDSAFDECPNLKELYLNFNNIKTIYPGTFKNLNKVETLYLLGNQLESIEEETFKGLAKLEVLWLKSNQIKDIHPDAFTHIPVIETLILDDNQISTLHESYFKGNGVFRLHGVEVEHRSCGLKGSLNERLSDCAEVSGSSLGPHRLIHKIVDSNGRFRDYLYFNALTKQITGITPDIYSETPTEAISKCTKLLPEIRISWRLPSVPEFNGDLNIILNSYQMNFSNYWTSTTDAGIPMTYMEDYNGVRIIEPLEARSLAQTWCMGNL